MFRSTAPLALALLIMRPQAEGSNRRVDWVMPRAVDNVNTAHEKAIISRRDPFSINQRFYLRFTSGPLRRAPSLATERQSPHNDSRNAEMCIVLIVFNQYPGSMCISGPICASGVKCAPALIIALLLSGCVTPPPEGTRADQSGPLKLCRGISVSNVTASELVGMNETVSVKSITLSRHPVIGCLSSGFGARKGGAGANHDGIDFFTGNPASVGAASAGRIVRVATLRGYGLTIDIDHGAGVTSRYAHLSKAVGREGQTVRAGEYIGRTGRSGNATAVHLHYEIRVNDRPINPLAESGDRPTAGF